MNARAIPATLVALLVIFNSEMLAQEVNADVGFAINIGGSSNDHGNAIAADGIGNYYIAGHYFGTLLLGNDEFTSAGNQDAYLAKLNAQGQVLWGYAFGGNGADEALGVASDAQGNCYVTGLLGSTNVSISDQTISSSGGYDVFVLKFDPNGVLLWSRIYGGNSNDIGRAIAVNNDGNISVSGSFQGIMNVGSTPLVSTALIDAFAFQLDPDGNALWATAINGPNLVEARGLAVDHNGHTYISGDFLGGSVSAGEFSQLGQGSYDIFIVKINDEGTVLQLQVFGNTGADSAVALATDALGNLFMAGYFEGSVAFGEMATVTSNGNRDMVIVKFNHNGIALWAQNVGVSGNDIAYALDTDAQENCYFTGLFSGTVQAGDFELSGGGTMVAKLNPNGEYLWALRFADPNVDNGGRGIVANDSGGLAIIGNFIQPFTIGGIEVESENARDAYVVRFNGVTVVGVSSQASPSTLKAFPNPCSTYVNLSLPDGVTVVQLFDPAGRMVVNTTLTAPVHRLEVPHLPTGNYIVRAVNGGIAYTTKLNVVQ